MPTKSNPVGPTGQRVAAHVVRLRAMWGMTKTDLSRQLGDLGRPMSLDVITKVEAGARPLDVDDLMALALALRVTTNQLLLPDREVSDVPLTGAKSAGFAEVWRWARGEQLLGAPADSMSVQSIGFAQGNRPEMSGREALGATLSPAALAKLKRRRRIDPAKLAELLAEEADDDER